MPRHHQPPSLNELEALLRAFPEWADHLARARSQNELTLTLRRLFEHFLEHLERQPDPREPMADQIIRYVVTHLHQGPTLKDLAAWLGYSEKYCSELVYRHLGIPLSHLRKRLRIERAKKMLAETDRPLSQIAECLGFSDAFAFSHFFKKATGMPPQRFRKQAREKRRSNSGKRAWRTRKLSIPARRARSYDG
jgi:AraC-like DNA-binding protein